MDWPFPLSSYSYSKISNSTGVYSKFYGIRVAKKIVYCSPSAYNSLWWTKSPLPCSSRENVVTSPNLWRGRVPLNIPSHWSILFHYFPLLRILSCGIATIRDFVFLVFSCHCFSLYLSLFCFFYYISSKWPFSRISEKYLLFNRIFEKKILE